MSRLRGIALLTLALATQTQAARVYTQQKSDAVFVRTIIVPSTELTLARAREESLSFLNATDGQNLRLRLLRVVTNSQDGAMMNGALGQGASFEQYLEIYDRVSQTVGPIGELTATGKGAILRFRIPKEPPKRVQLRGSDPLRGTVNGIPYDLLYIAVCISPRTRLNERESLRADTYIVTQHTLDEETGRLICADVFVNFAPPRSIAQLRNDDSFLEGFPVVFPFTTDARRPSGTALPTLVCEVSNCILVY